MSQKRAQKAAKRAQKKKALAAKEQQRRARREQEEMQELEEMLDSFDSNDEPWTGSVYDRLQYCADHLCYPCYTGAHKITSLSPCRLCLLAATELYRVSTDEIFKRLNHVQEQQADYKFDEFLRTNWGITRPYNCGPFMSMLQLELGKYVLALAAELTRDVPVEERSIDSWELDSPEERNAFCSSVNYLTTADDLYEILRVMLIDPLTEALRVDLQKLGLRLAKASFESEAESQADYIALCEKLGAEYLKELTAGKHKLSPKQYRKAMDELIPVNEHAGESYFDDVDDDDEYDDDWLKDILKEIGADEDDFEQEDQGFRILTEEEAERELAMEDQSDGSFEDRVQYCGLDLCFSCYQSKADLTRLKPANLSFLALSELYRTASDEFNGLLKRDPAEREDKKFERFLQSIGQDAASVQHEPFDTALEQNIAALILPLIAYLNQQAERSGDLVIDKITPDTIKLETPEDLEKFGSGHEAELGEELLNHSHQLLLDELQSAPIPVDVLDLGRRLVQTYVQSAPLTGTQRIELCQRLGLEYLQELQDGQHKFSAEEYHMRKLESEELKYELNLRGGDYFL